MTHFHAPANKTLGILGAGTIGEMLLRSLYQQSDVFTHFIASTAHDEKAQALQQLYSIAVTTDNALLVRECDVVLLCVKPQQMEAVFADLKNTVRNAPVSEDECYKNKLWISVAAGKNMEYLEGHLGDDASIVRCMPTIGSAVGEGVSVYVLNKNCTTEHEALVRSIFEKSGVVMKIEENDMPAATYLSCQIGLLAKYLETVQGTLEHTYAFSPANFHIAMPHILRTVAVLMEKELSLDQIYTKVASKGGATEAGHTAALSSGFYNAAAGIVDASIARLSTLGK